MLDTKTQPNPNPRLASKPIGVLLDHFATALPWLSDAHGLVQTGLAKNGKERYPQLYRQDGQQYTTDLRPDQRMQALCFFERDGPSLFESDDSLNVTGAWRHQLAAVVWLNLKKLATDRPYDFSEEVAEDFLARGLLSSPLGSDLQPERIEHQSERVFERYKWDQQTHQLLMYPYAGFRIPFTVLQRFTRCSVPFGQLDPPRTGFDYILPFAFL
jgi:hypothetical protein